MKQNYKIEENVQFKKRLTTFSVIMISIIISFFIAESFFQHFVYSHLVSKNAIIINNDDFTGNGRDFSYYIKSPSEQKKDEFIAHIPKSEIDKIGEELLTVFTPKMQCEAFEIYINDTIVAAEGDLENGNSNIWIQQFIYTIDSSHFDREINTIKVVQYSQYMSGGLGAPFTIDGYTQSVALKNITSFNSYQASFGISLFIFFLLILVIILFSKKRDMYAIMLSCLILMMVGYIEFFSISSMKIDFLLFKKIVASSDMLAIGFGTIYYRKLFGKNKNNIIILAVYSIIILTPAFITQNMATYKSVYTLLSFAVVVLILYWGYLSIKNLKKYTYSRLALTFSMACAIYVLIWTLNEVIQVIYLNDIVVVVMPTFMAFILSFIIIDFHELKLDLDASSKKLSTAYKKSTIDGLTSLYNVDYLKEVIQSIEPPFTFAVFDIDDFKTINDSYGHLAGDEALINLAKETSKLLREGDTLGRYGGDEFILILGSDSKDNSQQILERIKNKISESTFSFEETTLSFTISIGYYICDTKKDFKSLLHNADRALYQAKKDGKNKVVSFDSMSSDM